MAGARKTAKRAREAAAPHGKRNPQWTHGLKQLYDSVVEEPLPDAFRDLLSRLDDGGA